MHYLIAFTNGRIWTAKSYDRRYLDFSSKTYQVC